MQDSLVRPMLGAFVGSFLNWVDATESQYDGDERTRWPLLRTGERDEISDLVRLLVKTRDNFHCTLCGATGRLQLDHVIPWSAYGPDTSDNLRTLCADCNLDRSNYMEPWLPRITPVTIACDPCLVSHDSAMGRRHYRRVDVTLACPVCRGDGFEPGDEHWAAFCGTCTSTSWVGDRGRLL